MVEPLAFKGGFEDPSFAFFVEQPTLAEHAFGVSLCRHLLGIYQSDLLFRSII